jgi:anti-anti-sigma factor
MGIQTWSENTLLVELPPEPHIRSELDTVTKIVQEGGVGDVVIDFAEVGIINSLSLSGFLHLRKLLNEKGHRLIFCDVAPMTKKIFDVTCLNSNFEFFDEKIDALASIQSSR